MVASYNGVRAEKLTDHGRCPRLLDWIKGTDGQKILTDLGFMPLNEPRAGGRAGGRATIAASFLALPVVVLVARAFVSGELLVALSSPVVIDALVLSADHDGRQPGHRRRFWFASRPLPGAGARDASTCGSRPPSTCLSSCRRPSPAWRCCLCFGSRGLIGQSLSAFGVSIPFTTFAVVLAQVFVAAPFFIRSARTGISGVEDDLEDAARVDGATERHVLRWITVPLAAPALAAGLVMSGRGRSASSAPRSCLPATSRVGRRRSRSLSTASSNHRTRGLVAAATVLVLAAFVALIAVRFLHWGRALDTRVGSARRPKLPLGSSAASSVGHSAAGVGVLVVGAAHGPFHAIRGDAELRGSVD